MLKKIKNIEKWNIFSNIEYIEKYFKTWKILKIWKILKNIEKTENIEKYEKY